MPAPCNWKSLPIRSGLFSEPEGLGFPVELIEANPFVKVRFDKLPY
ncbi:MAG: hypothetical protein U5K51_15750 [Flavobacteriaceae bacterium]|nr:hypothetical protein [Flavobacteriaceae bacterium]